MKPKNNTLQHLGFIALAGFSPFGSQSAQAATKTWGGGSTVDSNWNTGANWDANTAPVANDSLVFDQNVRLSATNNFTAATQFNGITFATSAGVFTLSGNSITLGGNIADNSLNAETISLSLVLNATRSVDVASRMGSLTLGTGVISGSTFGITKTGSGILTLSGANTFTGDVTINGGVISIASDSTGTANPLGSGASGAGTLTLNGGTLRTTATTQLSTNRGVSLGASGGTIDVTSGTLTYNGVIAGGANTFTKTGTGTLALGGVSTYTGNTYVDQGTLKLDFTGLVGTTANIISSSSKLVIGGPASTVITAANGGAGATLNMTSKSGANSAQTFNGLQLGYGTAAGGGAAATISTTQTASGNNLLTLGAITHNAGGTVNFSLAGTLSANNAITTTTANTNDILGGWATYGSAGWAANDGSSNVDGSSNIVAYTGYIDIAASGATIANGSTTNVRINSGVTGANTLSGTPTTVNINSLLQNTSVASTLNMAAGDTLRFGAQGGVMVGTGKAALTLGQTVGNGKITAGDSAQTTGGEITFTPIGAGITVNSVIANNNASTGAANSSGGNAVSLSLTSGGGSLALLGANTYSGGTFINSGILVTNAPSGFGTGAVTILTGGQVYLQSTSSSGNRTWANDFYIAGLGDGVGAIRLDGVSATSAVSGKITLIGDARIGTNNRTGLLSGQITGGYNLEFGSTNNSGSITLSNAGTGANLNNWTGNTNIITVVSLGSSTGDLLPDGSGKGNVNIAGTLDLNGKTETINGLTGGGSIRNNATGTNITFTLGNNDATSSYGGTIVNNTSGTGTVAVTKTGAGTQTLSGGNTYSGATNVNAGTLQVSGSIGNSAVTVANSATLASGTTGTIGSSVSVSSDGTLAAGGVGAIGTATVGSGGLALSSGSIFAWDLSGATGSLPTANQGSYDKVVSNGTMSGTSIFNVVLGTSDFTNTFWDTAHTWSDVFTGAGVPSNLAAIFTTFSGTDVNTNGSVTGQGGFSFNGSTTLTWSAVPEPTTALSGLLLTVGLLRRRRKN